MTNVSIRELRNQGGEIVDRAASGERITITRGSRPVAELVPLQKDLPAEVLLERWRRLPPVDPDALRADIDEILDSSL
ncbi:MAG TPA: type II toxin-antitoxin system prevent-host-death family antitoxin [Solirubrobacterales bacterium]|nr:type II toxin-antitoxin system prevent-host-death family antitoxin [Solirubrobacterales bacterium]